MLVPVAPPSWNLGDTDVPDATSSFTIAVQRIEIGTWKRMVRICDFVVISAKRIFPVEDTCRKYLE